jgi:hypothetical protein
MSHKLYLNKKPLQTNFEPNRLRYNIDILFAKQTKRKQKKISEDNNAPTGQITHDFPHFMLQLPLLIERNDFII